MPRPELSTLRYPNLWQGCVGAWCPSQSGATGYRLFDDSGNNNHGTLTNMDPGADWVPSSNKLALDFDGSNDGVSVGSFNMNTLNNSTNCVSLWINPTTTNTIARPFSVGEFGTGFALRFNFQNLEFTFGGTAILSVAMDNASYAGKWTHVLGVTDNSGARLFFNGVQVGTRSDTVGITKTIGLGIGYRFGVNSDYFTGQLDDICLYNRALAPYEIRQLASSRGAAYERSRGRKKAYVPGYRITAPSRIQTGSARTIDGTDTESLSRGLVGAWCPSLGASGYRLLDRSGNGNHGVLTNMDPGTDWVPSGGKLALDFDGVNDQILANKTVAFAHDNKISIGCWAKVTSNGNRTVLVNFGSSFELWYPLFDGGSTIALGYPGASPLQSVSNSTVFNEWVHIFITRGGASSGLSSIYLNGIKLSLLTDTVSNHPAITSSTFIGCRDGATRFAVALLDDIRVYNRVLTSSEIRLLYTGGRGVGLMPEAKPKRARIVAWDNQDKISVPARVLTNTDSLKRGLVGHWSPSLSGPQGNRLMDLSGQNNHGTLTNMDYQTDYVPSTDKGGRMALDFDGVNDRVVVPYKSEFLASNLRAIACWVNLRSFDGDFQINEIISTDDVANASVRGWLVGVTDPNNNNLDGRFSIIIFGTGGSYIDASISTEKIAVNKWYHLVASYDGGTSELGLSIFLDGEKQAVVSSMSGAFTAPNLPTNPLWIGRRPGIAIDTYYNGQLDDIRLYNRTLTPNEIRLLAQSRMPERATPQRTRTVFYSSGLVSYLRRRTYNSILGSGVLS